MFGVDCLKCKGRLWCGLPQCPILSKIRLKKEIKLKKEYKSTTAGVFVGWHGYPNVFGGVLTPYNHAKPLSPKDWASKNFSIINVMNYLSSVIHPRKKISIRDRRFGELITKSALTYRPLSVDVSLKKVPELKISFNLHAQPFGPSADVKELKVNDDPKMKKAVSRVYYDNDLKANDAITYLYSHKVGIYDIIPLLSAGAVGVEKNRKLVPTRWAITAADDLLAKNLMDDVRNFPVLDHFIVFHGGHLGNIITVILLPRQWSYELIEEWNKGAVFAEKHQIVSDFEGFNGRKDYASNTTGGYYASRLPVVEWLFSHKIQASALVIRQVTKEYYMPLGVWVVREAVRKALKNPKHINDRKLMLSFAQKLTGIDLRLSKLIRERQTNLNIFI